MILHTRCFESWVPNCLYTSSKNIRYCKADSYNEMIGKIFENWFKYTLMKNLSPNERSIIINDNMVKLVTIHALKLMSQIWPIIKKKSSQFASG